jgi:hypothetical protein
VTGSVRLWDGCRSTTDSSEYYYCFFNVETASVIDEYLKECTDSGEVLQNDTPLIRDLNTLNTKKVNPLTIYNFKYIAHEIVEKSGVRDSPVYGRSVRLS